MQWGGSLSCRGGARAALPELEACVRTRGYRLRGGAGCGWMMKARRRAAGAAALKAASSCAKRVRARRGALLCGQSSSARWGVSSGEQRAQRATSERAAAQAAKGAEQQEDFLAASRGRRKTAEGSRGPGAARWQGRFNKHGVRAGGSAASLMGDIAPHVVRAEGDTMVFWAPRQDHRAGGWLSRAECVSSRAVHACGQRLQKGSRLQFGQLRKAAMLPRART